MDTSALGLAPLTPLGFLDRSADHLAERRAYHFDGEDVSYAGFRDRVRSRAEWLSERGVRPGDRVAVLARNSALALESHFAVPWAGAVLVALNPRLADQELAGILEHSGARLLLADPDLEDLADAAGGAVADGPVEVQVVRGGDAAGAGRREHPVTDETDLITLNYTSGTTGRPKGVMYRHRGAYLQALAMAYHLRLEMDSSYLWTLPMFHCNGWAFPWAVAAAGATSVCTTSTDPEELWRLVHEQDVSHLCAAPTLLNGLLASPAARPPRRQLTVATGGAPPTPALLRRAEEVGLHVVHLYGLTETYGPSLICDWQPEWDLLPEEEQAEKLSRQGIPNITAPTVRLEPLPDAEPGAPPEITVAGNTVMAGYFRDPDTTAAATYDDRFRTGDLAVAHDDGYLELQDRAKDIIISGGENIASVEVERVLAEHPAVSESAVVGVPDDRWGEIAVAFVQVAEGAEQPSAEELIEFVKARIARFKAPKQVHFAELPKTATGKIQKYELRSRRTPPPGDG